MSDATPTPHGVAVPGPAGGVRVLPSLPGTRRAWIEAAGQLSGLFLSLREAEITGAAVLPDPLHAGAALRAWTGATRPVLAAVARDATDGVHVPGDDVDVLAEAARVLGRHLLRERMGGAADGVTDVLRREARIHGREPERLVVQLTRVHGVLSATCTDEALAMWQAGT